MISVYYCDNVNELKLLLNNFFMIELFIKFDHKLNYIYILYKSVFVKYN